MVLTFWCLPAFEHFARQFDALPGELAKGFANLCRDCFGISPTGDAGLEPTLGVQDLACTSSFETEPPPVGNQIQELARALVEVKRDIRKTGAGCH